MSEITELTEQLGKLSGEMKAALAVLEDEKADLSRRREADAAVKTLATDLTGIKASIEKAEFEAEQKRTVAEMKAQLEAIRTPSMAGIINGGNARSGSESGLYLGPDYVKGSLLSAIYAMRGNDPDVFRAAKATLEGLGVRYADLPEASKATLGTSGATGGYVLPNNLVDTLVKPSTQEAIYQDLLTVRSGVNVRAVDLPYRPGAPARMTVKAWGDTKENTDETYGSYTATLYTIARIYDLSKQYLRFSAGSAEEDVMDELSKAAALGENYYVINGSGSSQPLGILTAVAASDPAFTSSFTPSATTLAGSMSTLLAKLAGVLASRTQPCTAFVANAADYWTMAAQGTDAAGFFFAPANGPSAIRPGTLMTPWGIPVYHDANLTAKTVIAGNWKAAKFFRGLEFRVDSSDQAGERWDRNEVGFRGEEEIGFNASTAVAVGAFQVCTTAVV